ncbi:MAG: 16S rRNA (cytosine(1402)-N(4))-methyltransferase RsmH [Deltaproteobacteria bacterium]|nr:16S rRNA (cytosine(1402)-N(4))-methyltransferase RsmH [Deltaproteobacteria bacterium]MBI3391172.1 16S rRNA (cytosine(1402)-N(4))-methyltransferase RsmH [Deltaproteobacteria bacterium]
MTQPVHIPVMLPEVLAHLVTGAGGRFVDATIDGGGHAAAILERTAPAGRVLGIDRDPDLLTALRGTLAAEVESGRLVLASGSFQALTTIVEARQFAPVDGVLFDLGLSSYHFDVSGRGFSFMRGEPLDMRFDPTDTATETAADLLRTRTHEQLRAIFQSFGEERFSGRIAGRIMIEREATPITTTDQLFELIATALPARLRWRAARSAARIFQALRIAVNDELEAISEALPQALALLNPGGRLVVIAFHSLEDRLVKQFFVAERGAGRVRVVTKRPLRPTEAEVATNPRAASAKLRVAEKL